MRNFEETPQKILTPQVFLIKKIKNKKISMKTKTWTEDEDKLLISLYNKNCFKKWKTISKSFLNKNEKECMLRYLKINPKIKKGKWVFEEDRNLFYLVKIFGFRWGLFAKILKTRNHKQIRSRYHHFFLRYKKKNQKEIQKIEDSVEENPPITIL
jgi:hypothetical protein